MRIEEIKYLEIQDSKLFQAVKKAYAHYQKKLKLLPSSFTGHHHPPADREIGGMLNHISNLCWYVEQYSEEFQLTKLDKDKLMVAAFFHDLSECDINKMELKVIISEGPIIKEIRREWTITRNDDEAHYHPLKSAEIADFYLEQEEVPETDLEEIKNIISSHMGHYSPDLPQPLTRLERALALGDYIVSRDEFNIGQKIEEE